MSNKPKNTAKDKVFVCFFPPAAVIFFHIQCVSGESCDLWMKPCTCPAEYSGRYLIQKNSSAARSAKKM